MNEALTPAQRAGRTNHERAEQRKEKWRKELEETKLIREAANIVLRDPEAALSDKLRAAEIIEKMRRY